MKVDIINIDDSLAAIALRSVLEYFGGKSLHEAHQKASSHDSDTAMFKLYQK